MNYKSIIAQLSAADAQAVKDAFALILQKLPFLITLTPAERKGLFKAGPERLSFVESALQAANNNPNILPASFDLTAFQNSVALFSTVTDLNTVAAQVQSQLDDTHMDIGAQALDQSSDVYHYIQAAANKTPGLKPLADQLGQLYQKAVATRRANKAAQMAKAA